MNEVPLKFHPSVFILEEIEERGWSIVELAQKISKGRKYPETLLSLDLYFNVGPTNKNLRIGDEMAQEFADVFGVSKEYFLNLEKQYLEQDV